MYKPLPRTAVLDVPCVTKQITIAIRITITDQETCNLRLTKPRGEGDYAFHHAHEAVEYALEERPGPAHVALLRETAGLSQPCFGFGGRAPISVLHRCSASRSCLSLSLLCPSVLHLCYASLLCLSALHLCSAPLFCISVLHIW